MSNGLKYDEFVEKLDLYVKEFEAFNKKKPESFDEFRRFLVERKVRTSSKRRNLTSLKFIGK
jgi:hypothetical protein